MIQQCFELQNNFTRLASKHLNLLAGFLQLDAESVRPASGWNPTRIALAKQYEQQYEQQYEIHIMNLTVKQCASSDFGLAR